MMSIQIAFKKSTFQNELEENTSNISNVSILNLCSKFRSHRSSTQWLGWACQLIKHIARQSWPIRWPWMWCASGTWTWAPNGTNITSQVELPKQIPLWFAVLEFQDNRRRQVIVVISWQQATSTSLSGTVRLADCWKIKEVVQDKRSRARVCKSPALQALHADDATQFAPGATLLSLAGGRHTTEELSGLEIRK